MKLLVLLFGLAVGFGGGVYWGVHHPTEAGTLSSEEEKRFLQLQIKTSEAIKGRLDAMSAKKAAPAGGVSGFVNGFASGGANGATQAEVDSVRNDQEAQLRDLHARLDKLK